MDKYPVINEKIKLLRLQLNLSESEVARRIRQSIYEYGDIESHPSEIFSVVPVYHIKKLCTVLQTDIFKLFDISCSFCEENTTQHEDYFLRRDLLIHKRRNELGITSEELGDKIGFYENEIILIETYTAHLESWVLENISELANQLKIPLQILLDIECKNCNKNTELARQIPP